MLGSPVVLALFARGAMQLVSGGTKTNSCYGSWAGTLTPHPDINLRTEPL